MYITIHQIENTFDQTEGTNTLHHPCM